jgi:hypothetical protein
MSKHVGITLSVFLLVLYTGARGTDHPPFSNFLFANKKVIIFESHHVQKKISASHFKNAEKPPQIFHFL